MDNQENVKFKAKIYALPERGNTLARVGVTVNDAFVVRGVRVLKGKSGPFVSMPREKMANGDYRDICFPCTKEAKVKLEHVVLGAYHMALQETQNEVADKLHTQSMQSMEM